MRKLYLCLLMGITFAFLTAQEIKHEGPSVDLSRGKLKVSQNQRYLVFEDGTPFFYLGDTAWELFHRLTLKEAETYLENRREKGFTVIQAVALAELDGLNAPNTNGDKPLIDNDPLKPNEAYFEHVDAIIQIAQNKGIFIGLLPTWGDKVEQREWGIGPVIFNTENAFSYGKWIGKRYKNQKNIIWIVGGDRHCHNENWPVWDAMARGIKKSDKNHLMTYHPIGTTSSSECYHDADWLDFNMYQSGHAGKYLSNYDRITTDYGLMPVKPCMDGEPCYEDHPIRWKAKYGWFNENDVRMAAYWALFSGAHGHTYGCHPVWQMLDDGRKPIGEAHHKWHEVLDLPGAWQMLYVRRLVESRPVLSRVPCQALLIYNSDSKINHITATMGDGYAFVYLPANYAVTVDMNRFNVPKLKAWWYNPRNGEAVLIGEIESATITNQNAKTFEVPVKGTDWVLVLDDASKGYGTPGVVE